MSYTKAIDQKRQELGDIGFRREMLLQVVPEEGQDVLAEDITYYYEPPFDDGNHLAHGVDLAISTKESAHYTAIVSGEVTWPAGKTEIYLQPNPIIRRMTFQPDMAEGVGRAGGSAARDASSHRRGRQALADEILPVHSITSSARGRSDCGTVSPSALAVLRLITSSKLVGRWIGRSAGFSPLRTLPA